MNKSDYVSKALSLSYVPRWSIVDMAKDQSVAEHSYNVTILSMAIGEIAKRYGLSFDYGALLEEALLHDMDEALTGDIPSTITKENIEFESAEQTIIKIADRVEALLHIHRYGRNTTNIVEYLTDKLNRWTEILIIEIHKDPPTWINMEEVSFKIRQELDQLIHVERAYERAGRNRE